MYRNRSSLREFVRYVSRKVANGELFGEKPTDVPKFDGLSARRIDEVAASVLNDHFLFSSISGPPERARTFSIAYSGKPHHIELSSIEDGIKSVIEMSIGFRLYSANWACLGPLSTDR
jgi:hypothetical protein